MPKITEKELSNKQIILIEMIFEYIEKIYELMKNYDEKNNEKTISI